MINFPLYRREMKGSIRILLIFAAVITLYVSVIITMYDPEMMKTLDEFVEVMPELMSAVGMHAGATSLLGFMISYLYGFILIIFPMLANVGGVAALFAGGIVLFTTGIVIFRKKDLYIKKKRHWNDVFLSFQCLAVI